MSIAIPCILRKTSYCRHLYIPAVLIRVLAGVVATVMTAHVSAAQPLERLTIIAPAAPGGGWDQTARAMQHALTSSGLVANVQVENVPGAAGTIGLAQLVNAHAGDGDTLLVTGLVMVGAIVFNQSPVSLSQVTPIARLTGEYEVIAVPADSPIQTIGDLAERLRRAPGAISWGGGSAGGTDHILAGLIASAAGVDARRVNYIAFSGGGEAVAALLGSQVTAGISGYSEFAPHIQAGRLRGLAISAPTRVPAIPLPTIRESQLDVELANWRAVVAPPGIPPNRQQQLIDLIDRMVQTRAWRETLATREWTDQWLAGGEFARFMDAERVRVTRIATRLRASSDTPRSPADARLFPAIILAGAVAVVIWLVRERRRHATLQDPLNRRALAIAAAGLALFLILLVPFGFIPAAFVLFFATASAFDSAHRTRDALVSLIFAVVVYLAFTRGLTLSLPAGFFAR
jgi:putative tricarboxylic transport membrane protein